MRTSYITLATGIFVALAAGAVSSHAQQVTVGSPFRTLHSSFYENNSISWSGNYRGISFSFGNPSLTTPQFGSPNQAAALTANFAIVGKDGRINFATSFGQGAQQSIVTQAPSVTIMNGQTGYMSDTSQTPFVISVIPVVGAFPVVPQPPEVSGNDSSPDPRIQAMLQAHADAQGQAEVQAAAQAQAGGPVPPLPPQQRPNAMAPRQDKKAVAAPDPVPDAGEAAGQRLNAAQESTAGRPALSVAEAKRLHQQEQATASGEMAALMERARALEDDGQPSVAKIYYQRIAKHATGQLQQEAQTRLYELQGGKR